MRQSGDGVLCFDNHSPESRRWRDGEGSLRGGFANEAIFVEDRHGAIASRDDGGLLLAIGGRWTFGC